MKRCWIHVGMHKTGSTSVQTNLAKIKSPLNWRYIKVDGRVNMNQSLYAMFSPSPHKYHWFAKRGMTEEQVTEKGKIYRQKLRKQIRKCKKENIIISAEALSIINQRGITALAKFLKPLCDEIRVIGYVRPPTGYKISIFQERIKHGINSFEITDIRLNYRKRFEKFDIAFGQENVFLKKFEPSSFPNKCIVADFVQELNIALPDDTKITRSNEGLCREACGILYAYRKFGPGYGVGNNAILQNAAIIAPMLAMRGQKFKVAQGIMISGEAEDEDQAWIEKRIGSSLQENVKEDGTEVTSEDDLLLVRRSSCEDFAAHFTRIHGLEIAAHRIPASDPVDPRDVAEFIEYCRGLCRTKIRSEKATKKANKIIRVDDKGGTPDKVAKPKKSPTLGENEKTAKPSKGLTKYWKLVSKVLRKSQ